MRFAEEHYAGVPARRAIGEFSCWSILLSATVIYIALTSVRAKPPNFALPVEGIRFPQARLGFNAGLRTILQ